MFEAGAKNLGYKNVHTGRMAINSEPRDGRTNCQQAGFCFQGCKFGAKWSSAYSDIPKGEATGNLEVRTHAQVLKIEHDAKGKVTGVIYADKDGNQQMQKARIVAVAGNSIESPRLLLNSASSVPDGLANSSGQVGKNYMRHMTASMPPFSPNLFVSGVGLPWQELLLTNPYMIHPVDLLEDTS